MNATYFIAIANFVEKLSNYFIKMLNYGNGMLNQNTSGHIKLLVRFWDLKEPKDYHLQKYKKTTCFCSKRNRNVWHGK